MLFPYRYISHDVEKVQVWLDHLVKQVWCRNSGTYSIDLLHAELKAVVEEIANDDRITVDHLDGPIKEIDASFQSKLTPAQRSQVKEWFDNNNDIEALCSNDPSKSPVTYADLANLDEVLARLVKTFCKKLFTDVIGLKAVYSRSGQIEDHYDAFMGANDECRCPYCGYGDIKGVNRTKREAYDHFLPKGKYPFSSVNFRNLAPMCHECNSSYKGVKDPIRRDDGNPRKAFYSYSPSTPRIAIEVSLSATDIDTMAPTDVSITVSAPGRRDEVGTWMEVFGIEERYRDKCCAKNDGKYWLWQAIDECMNVDMTVDEIMEKIERNANSHPWAEANFLKRAFLAGCHKAGLLP